MELQHLNTLFRNLLRRNAEDCGLVKLDENGHIPLKYTNPETIVLYYDYADIPDLLANSRIQVEEIIIEDTETGEVINKYEIKSLIRDTNEDFNVPSDDVYIRGTGARLNENDPSDYGRLVLVNDMSMDPRSRGHHKWCLYRYIGGPTNDINSYQVIMTEKDMDYEVKWEHLDEIFKSTVEQIDNAVRNAKIPRRLINE